jgi:hypothetical protein
MAAAPSQFRVSCVEIDLSRHSEENPAMVNQQEIKQDRRDDKRDDKQDRREDKRDDKQDRRDDKRDKR